MNADTQPQEKINPERNQQKKYMKICIRTNELNFRCRALLLSGNYCKHKNWSYYRKLILLCWCDCLNAKYVLFPSFIRFIWLMSVFVLRRHLNYYSEP